MTLEARQAQRLFYRHFVALPWIAIEEFGSGIQIRIDYSSADGSSLFRVDVWKYLRCMLSVKSASNSFERHPVQSSHS